MTGDGNDKNIAVIIEALAQLNGRVSKLENDQVINTFKRDITQPTDENGFRSLTQESYPKWNDATRTLIIRDKRKDTDFNLLEIEGIQKSDCTLLYNTLDKRYYVLKNRDGECSFEFPDSLLIAFLKDPKGNLQYSWIPRK